MKSTITGQKFAKSDIRLDGKYFVGCSFENCVLRFGGTEVFGFQNCTASNARFEFDGHAAAVLSALSVLYGSGFKSDVESLFQRIRDMSKTRPGFAEKPN